MALGIKSPSPLQSAAVNGRAVPLTTCLIGPFATQGSRDHWLIVSSMPCQHCHLVIILIPPYFHMESS
jgi:hypothetical protein